MLIASSRKKMAIVSFKYISQHPRVNLIANTFNDENYDVTVIGLDQSPKRKENYKGISFITFPMRSTVQSRLNTIVCFPARLSMGLTAGIILFLLQNISHMMQCLRLNFLTN